MNVSKAKVEGLFADELALLQQELDRAERAAKTIQARLDQLDEAFLFERTIDVETYDRHAERLREELTLVRIEPAGRPARGWRGQCAQL